MFLDYIKVTGKKLITKTYKAKITSWLLNTNSEVSPNDTEGKVEQYVRERIGESNMNRQKKDRL